MENIKNSTTIKTSISKEDKIYNEIKYNLQNVLSNNNNYLVVKNNFFELFLHVIGGHSLIFKSLKTGNLIKSTSKNELECYKEIYRMRDQGLLDKEMTKIIPQIINFDAISDIKKRNISDDKNNESYDQIDLLLYFECCSNTFKFFTEHLLNNKIITYDELNIEKKHKKEKVNAEESTHTEHTKETDNHTSLGKSSINEFEEKYKTFLMKNYSLIKKEKISKMINDNFFSFIDKNCKNKDLYNKFFLCNYKANEHDNDINNIDEQIDSDFSINTKHDDIVIIDYSLLNALSEMSDQKLSWLIFWWIKWGNLFFKNEIILMEDLTANINYPIVFDFKLGNDPKKGKEQHSLDKMKISTSHSLGFKLMGAQYLKKEETDKSIISILNTNSKKNSNTNNIDDNNTHHYPIVSSTKWSLRSNMLKVDHKYNCRKLTEDRILDLIRNDLLCLGNSKTENLISTILKEILLFKLEIIIGLIEKQNNILEFNTNSILIILNTDDVIRLNDKYALIKTHGKFANEDHKHEQFDYKKIDSIIKKCVITSFSEDDSNKGKYELSKESDELMKTDTNEFLEYLVYNLNKNLIVKIIDMGHTKLKKAEYLNFCITKCLDNLRNTISKA